MITDHGVPTFAAVDEVVDAIRDARRSDALLYTHCAGGDGRTTTVMAMADMLQNAAGGISFDEIMNRQAAIGGEDLTETTKPGTVGTLQKARLEMLRHFYSSAQDNPNGEPKSFRDWAQANGIVELQPNYGD